jgi:hypothetical protein
MKWIYLIVLCTINCFSYSQPIIINGYTGKYSTDLNHRNDQNLNHKYDGITLITIAPNDNYKVWYNQQTVYIKQSNLLPDTAVQRWKNEKIEKIKRSSNKKILGEYAKEFGAKYASDVIQGNIRIGMPEKGVTGIMGQPQTITKVLSDNTATWVCRRRNNSEVYFLYFKNGILIRWIDNKN